MTEAPYHKKIQSLTVIIDRHFFDTDTLWIETVVNWVPLLDKYPHLLFQIRNKRPNYETAMKRAHTQLPLHPKIIFNTSLKHALTLSDRPVHLPERELAPIQQIFGASIHDPTKLIYAQDSQASWVQAGPIYSPISKSKPPMKSICRTEILRNSNIPVLAVGGINQTNAVQTLDMGFDGIVTMGHIWTSNTPMKNMVHLAEMTV